MIIASSPAVASVKISDVKPAQGFWLEQADISDRPCYYVLQRRRLAGDQRNSEPMAADVWCRQSNWESVFDCYPHNMLVWIRKQRTARFGDMNPGQFFKVECNAGCWVDMKMGEMNPTYYLGNSVTVAVGEGVDSSVVRAGKVTQVAASQVFVLLEPDGDFSFKEIAE